jgi:hypothetical protein
MFIRQAKGQDYRRIAVWKPGKEMTPQRLSREQALA